MRNVHPRPSIRRGPPAARAARALALALALLAAGVGGCAGRGARLRDDPTAAAARPSGTAARIAEAHEQSAMAPHEPYWPYRLAEIHLEADSLARAEEALRTSLRRDAGYAPALLRLSKLWYDTGRHQEGVELLEAARARATAAGSVPAAEVVAALALHYEALGRHDLAAARVADAPGTDAGGARSARVLVALRGDDTEAARALARAALDADPRSAVNQNNYGITRLRGGDPREARIAFLRAIALDPQLPGPYYNLSIVDRYFLFDEASANRWLKAYRERATADPDGLFGMIETGGAPPAAEKGR